MVKPLASRKPAISKYQLTLTDRSPAPGQSSRPRATPITVTVEQGEFIFHLDAIALSAIHQAQANDITLTIPTGLMADLQHYSLLEESEIGRGKTGAGKLRSIVHLQSGLTFQTCWYEASSTPQARPGTQYQIKAARTIIALDGDVLYQVCKDYLHHPQGQDILTAHCWLMNQLLQRFRSNIAHYLDLAVWAVPILTIGGNLTANVGGLTNPAALPQAVMGIALSLSSFAAPLLWNFLREKALPIVLPTLQRWIWRQLLTPNSPFQKLAKAALRL